MIQQQQREEEWYLKKLGFEKQISETQAEYLAGGDSGKHGTSSTQSVKLQKYTISHFSGDYKDWLRFWNQFTVVDGSLISEISKFNYLLELVKGKPKDDILGLPHTQGMDTKKPNGFSNKRMEKISNYTKRLLKNWRSSQQFQAFTG